MLMSLFEVMHNNERVILYSDGRLGIIYTWNKSQTLQVWEWKDSGGGRDEGYEEIDITTLTEVPKDLAEAEREIASWHLARAWGGRQVARA